MQKNANAKKIKLDPYLTLCTKINSKQPKIWDFPGGPVDKTPRSQCRGPRFDPWSGS